MGSHAVSVMSVDVCVFKPAKESKKGTSNIIRFCGAGGCHKHSGVFCSATQDVMTHFVWAFPQWGGHVCTETLLPSCLALLRANGKVEEWKDGAKLL